MGTVLNETCWWEHLKTSSLLFLLLTFISLERLSNSNWVTLERLGNSINKHLGVYRDFSVVSDVWNPFATEKKNLFESVWLHLSRYRLLQQPYTSPVSPTPGLGSDRWVGPFSQSPAQETVRQLTGNISRQEVGWGTRGSPPITSCLSSRQEDPGQQILQTNAHHMLPTHGLNTLGRILEC